MPSSAIIVPLMVVQGVVVMNALVAPTKKILDEPSRWVVCADNVSKSLMKGNLNLRVALLVPVALLVARCLRLLYVSTPQIIALGCCFGGVGCALTHRGLSVQEPSASVAEADSSFSDVSWPHFQPPELKNVLDELAAEYNVMPCLPAELLGQFEVEM